MRIFLLTVFLSALISRQALARGQNGLTISGIVQDQTKAVLPGAQVELLKNGTLERTTITDTSGAFRFDRIQPGNYEVRAQREGFKTGTTKITAGTRSPAPVRIVLSIQNLNQEITVNEDSGVSTDASENRDVVAIDKQALDDLPIFDQNYVATMSRFLDSGALGTSGVTLIVDGIQMNSTLSASAIQQVKINQNPYSAEFNRPGRGRIEVITRPASPEYHGTLNLFFRDARLNARDPFALTRPSEQRRIFEGSLLGPLGDGKTTSFMITGNRQEQDNQSIVFANGPAGLVQQNVPNPQRNTEFSIGMNRLHSKRTMYSLRYQYRNRNIRNQGVGRDNLAEVATNFRDREDQIFYTVKTTFSMAVVNNFGILFARQHTPTVSVNSGPKIVVLDAFTSGVSQGDRLHTENHTVFNDVFSWTREKHTFQAGINVPDISRRGLDDNTNKAGTFSFSSLQDYFAGRPFSFVQQRGNGHIVFWEKVMGGFFQDEYQLRPNLALTAGLRYDWQNYFHDNNNFSPRISLAFAPGRSRKTVFRSGAGFFYDRTGPGPIFDLLRFDGVRLQRFLISNPGYPNPYANAGVSAQPSSLVRQAADVRIPYTIQYSVSVERELQRATTLTVSYFRVLGVGMFRSRDINAPLPPLYLTRPDPSVNVLRQIESSGRQVTQSLEISFRGNATKYFTGMAQYTLGYAHNDTNGIGAFPANNYDLSGEWARADFDQRHRFNLLGTIKPGHLVNLGASLQLESGRPYSLATGLDSNHDGLAIDRPAGVRRNSLNGPGYVDIDLRCSKDFLLNSTKGEKGPKLTAAIDAFNVTNRVSFDNYVGTLSSPFFGQAISARPARRLQLSMRYQF